MLWPGTGLFPAKIIEESSQNPGTSDIVGTHLVPTPERRVVEGGTFQGGLLVHAENLRCQ